MALPQNFSFTPGFSLVLCSGRFFRNRFNGFRAERGQTVETVSALVLREDTRLKPGVNERDF